MTKLSTLDKQYMDTWLMSYVQRAGDRKLRLKTYARAVQWCHGMTFEDIAEDEQVSKATVARSVKALYDKISLWVPTQNPIA